MNIQKRIPVMYAALLPVILIITFYSYHLPAQEKPAEKEASKLSDTATSASVEKKASAAMPDVSEIIPLAAQLSGRLKVLTSKTDSGLDLTVLEEKFATIEKELNGITNKMFWLRDKEYYRYSDLIEIKTIIDRKNDAFDEIILPLDKAIRRFDSIKKEWLQEKDRWDTWEASLLKDGAYSQLTSTFVKAHATIDAALAAVLPQFEKLLAVKIRAGIIQERFFSLSTEINVLVSTWRRSFLLFKSYPMYSKGYISQFSPKLWHATRENIYEVLWSRQVFSDNTGWIVFLQGFVTVFMVFAICRNKETFGDIKHWKFLCACPVAAAFATGILATGGIYEYWNVSVLWRLINIVVFGICLARLFGNLLEVSWKKLLLYWLILVNSIVQFLFLVNPPSPIFRLSIVLTALVSLVFFWVLIKDCRRYRDRETFTRLLRFGSAFFIVIIIAEVLGKEGLLEYVFISVIRTIVIVLGFILLMRIMRGALIWLFCYSPLKRVTAQWQDLDSLIGQISFFINVLLWAVFVCYLLLIWGVYQTFEAAVKGFLTFGIDLNVIRISVSRILLFTSIIYCIYFMSGIFQKLFVNKVFARRKVELGAQIAIRRLINYFIIVIGFILACSMFGFGLTRLTIILGALGVGIGFGLQGVVNNFVSGLILLFERPVRIGDTVEIDGKWGEIKAIGLRSTVVQTLDQADVIIPNADLITTKVTNWTLSSRQVRGTIPVGVAYGSDIPLVMQILQECAAENNLVSALPEPQVLFLHFGENSLEFELRIWIIDTNYRLKVISELHQEIDQRFRKAAIEIAFPQRDVHLRNSDTSLIPPLPDSQK